MFIYTYNRFGERYEQKFETIDEIFGLAFWNVEDNTAYPVSITNEKGEVILSNTNDEFYNAIDEHAIKKGW